MSKSFLRMLVLLASACVTNLVASDVVVIVNPNVGVASLSADELKGIFLLTKTSFNDGSRAEVVLAKNGPAHQTFVGQYLGKTEAALQTYYRSLVFTGKASMPKILGSDTEVIAYVAKTKGAVGYVPSDTSIAGAKVVAVK